MRRLTFHDTIFVFIIMILICGLMLKGKFIYNLLKNNRNIYHIRVNSYNKVETYLTDKYEKNESSGCISFKDEFEIKRIVCNSYTITQY
jgi:hypothetical protein